MLFKSRYLKLLELIEEFSIIFQGVINNHGNIITQLTEQNRELHERIHKLEKRLDEG